MAGSGLILFAMRGTEFRGDEVTYAAGARALADWATGRGVSWPEAFATVVGSGWFMPGTSFLAAPLYAVWQGAPNWAAFAWLGVINAVLLAALLRAMRSVVGAAPRRIMLVFPLLAPLWLVSALSVLPDVPGGLMLTIAMASAWRIGMAMLRGDPPAWQSIAALVAVLAAALYLRGPLLPAALGLHAILIAIALGVRGAPWRQRLGWAGRLATGLAAFAALLAPWSLSVSRQLDYPVLTTISFPLAFAGGFGDPRRLCFGPCEDGRDINRVRAFAEARAAETGAHPIDVQRAMMAASLQGLGARAYLARVRQHFGAFVFDPGSALRHKLGLSFAIRPDWRQTVLLTALIPTWLLYLPGLLALLAVNLAVLRSSDAAALQAVLIKGITACLFVQPFLHSPSGRYWVTFAPLLAWSAVLLAQTWRARHTATAEPRRMPHWLDAMQAIYAAGLVVLSAAILLA